MNATLENVPPRMTSAQCLVGGFVGFGLFTAILCLMVGGGFWFWLVMTTFLNIVYTVTYFLRKRGSSNESD